MFVAIVAMTIRIVLMAWWSGMLGAAGIALAYAVGVLLEGGALWWMARQAFAPAGKLN